MERNTRHIAYSQYAYPPSHTTSQKAVVDPIICGIIAKANNQQLNVIQDVLPIVLYGGRTTSMVSSCYLSI